MHSELYLVWSIENRGWVGLQGGYTPRFISAASFDRNAALHMCHLLRTPEAAGAFPVRLEDMLAVIPAEAVAP